MRTALILSVVVALGCATMIPHLGPAIGKAVPTYNVDIDAPLREQWAPILADF